MLNQYLHFPLLILVFRVASLTSKVQESIICEMKLVKMKKINLLVSKPVFTQNFQKYVENPSWITSISLLKILCADI